MDFRIIVAILLVSNAGAFQRETNTVACASEIVKFNVTDKRDYSYVLEQNEAPISDMTNISYHYGQWFGEPSIILYTGSAPGLRHCGTLNPIYLQDESPMSTNITTLRGCIQEEKNDCVFAQLQVTYCENLNYHIYKLYNDFGDNTAYCTAQFNSELNYRTKVNVDVPVPSEENGMMKYKFLCKFDLDRNTTYFYTVRWYKNNKLIKTFDSMTHSGNLQDLTSLQEDMVDEITLGYKLQCSYAVSLQADSEKSYDVKSSQRLIGIEILTPNVNIKDGGSKAAIRVRPRVPFACLSTVSNCFINVNIIDPKASESNTACNPSSSFSGCGIKILSSDWDREYNVTVSADPATQYGSKSAVNIVNLRTSVSFPSQPAWQNYDVGNVSIQTSYNTANIKGAQCYAVCDPHMRTFGGKSYEHQYGGLYTLYENKDWNQEIQMKTEPCSRNGAEPYCPCGVAIRVGKEVFVIERCGTATFWTIQYNQCSTTGTRLIAISKSGNMYRFKLPSGLILKTSVYQQQKFINLYLTPSEADKTAAGLCGQVGSALFYTREGGTVGYVDRPGMPVFSNSWKVTTGMIDLFSNQITTLTPIQTGGFFCKCSIPESATEPVFSCEKSADECVTITSTKPVDSCKVGEIDIESLPDANLESPNDGQRFEQMLARRKRDSHSIAKRGTSATSWRNGWTQDTATDYCNNLFSNSTFVYKCKTSAGVDLTPARKNCVLDIEYMGDISYALVAIDTITSQCVQEVAFNPELHKPNGGKPSVLEQIKEVACPLQCSLQGTCENGVCNCDEGFAGVDCATDLNVVPQIATLEKGGKCNVMNGTCTQVSVFGGDFVDHDTLRCKVIKRELDVDGFFKKISENEHKPMVKSIGEVVCYLSKNRKERNTVERPEVEFVTVYDIYVSNNGANYSQYRSMALFNSDCQTCSINGDVVSCNYTGDGKYCMSGGQCYAHGDMHKEHKCYKCMIEVTESEISGTSNEYEVRSWDRIREGDCSEEGEENMLWIIGVVFGILAVFIIGILIVYCFKKRSKGSGGASWSKNPRA
ncbi:hypothetical protein LOTGIDRAFT_234808 [Lottia gigantea]|uniref:VWFD domain-containing protein n=1 Tax=Lottia gigantea TaxID=225164 RepID=V3ZZF3_LOTGI|nr:hypothetical protein LOTGIDRAFT_234808 [Lottia gigantea]ESO88040.1 hypothetical protein LOTGIDRAFT_234808 [Lottia gigantea]